MEAQAIAQLLAIIFGVLGIIWHQQHNTNQLRAEFTKALDGFRAEVFGALDGLRAEVFGALDGLRAEVASLGQRLARIEGFLKIGMPAEATAEPEPAAVDPPS